MEDVITLSSDEEQDFEGPAAKKAKIALNFCMYKNWRRPRLVF